MENGFYFEKQNKCSFSTLPNSNSLDLRLQGNTVSTNNFTKMKKINFFFFLFIIFIHSQCQPPNPPEVKEEDKMTNIKRPEYTIVIHGGAGSVSRENTDAAREKMYTDSLNHALNIGEEILKNGGSALDAVEKTIRFMEDCPLFNSGKGAVFTHEGTNELDASIMDGSKEDAGAVGGVKTIKHPISAARAVMEKSPHVFLSREGAETFAQQNGLEQVDNSYFFTQKNYDRLQRILEKEKTKQQGYDPSIKQENPDWKYGTVGCAVLDKAGNLAAGTSTGGMTNKRWSRIGDSPIIGAGTYANNKTCAISSTGHGEYFIRYAVAYDISARMEYGKQSFQEAAEEVVMKKLVEKGGSGGIIGVDKFGNVAMPFNTAGMFRAYAKPEERVVKMFPE